MRFNSGDNMLQTGFFRRARSVQIPPAIGLAIGTIDSDWFII
jgi:hypothetical protein